jgi:excisionase family DNA binding protein
MGGRESCWLFTTMPARMKDPVGNTGDGIGGTMLHQKPIEMVSNSVIVRRLLNVGETALYLGVKVDTVYKWSRMGVLSKVKLGGALRFDVNVLDRFIEQHSTKTIDY